MAKIKIRSRKIKVCDICGEHVQGECGTAESVITVTDDSHNRDEYIAAIKKRRMHLCDLHTTSLENWIATQRYELTDSVLKGDFYDELIRSMSNNDT